MGKDKIPFTFTEIDEKGASTTFDVPQEYAKYTIRCLENTYGLEEYTEKIKQFLGEYILMYQKAMNIMGDLIQEIDGKIEAIQERRFPDQPVNEFCFEIMMLNKELEMHYSVMEPIRNLYKIIKQKDSEVFEKGYNNCAERVEEFLGKVVDIIKKQDKD